MYDESPEEIYSSMENVWPVCNRWYNYTHKKIVDFVYSTLSNRLNSNNLYLNAGSGGSKYDLLGTCHHVDIAENLIKGFPHYTVASIEDMPFPTESFDAAICVGSVLNYCDVAKSISELSRTLKPNGYLVLEFERSNTGELWFTKEYGLGSTVQRYEYLGHIHTLWLYSERLVKQLLIQNSFHIVKRHRFHCLSALVNRIVRNEEFAGKFGGLDSFFMPISYSTAHNVIFLCQKLL